MPLAFLAGITAGTVLLMLPMARAGGMSGTDSADFMAALFTATSALCVTGLTVVDTPSYWSPFGHVVLLLLLETGGLGIMTGATLLGLLVTRALPLRSRLMASAEMRSLDLGDVGKVLRLVVVATLAGEAVLTVWLTARFWSWGMPFGPALWHGLFHACSAFMNTGFSTLPEGLAPHRNDILFLLPLMLGVIVGGIGFPVLFELHQEWRRPQRWSIHTKLTLWGSVALILVGMLIVAMLEWRNVGTLGGRSMGSRLLGALFHSVMTRSGGFSVDDPALMRPDTILVSSALMLIGGGSASTAGGIRVTTFLLLGFVVWSEVRGRPESIAFGRRIAHEAQRQALAVVLTALATVSVALLVLAGFVQAPVERIAFEVISAFATVGLSTGLSAEMPPAGQFILVVMMYVGRVGTVSLATALALRAKAAPYRFPEERPIVG